MSALSIIAPLRRATALVKAPLLILAVAVLLAGCGESDDKSADADERTGKVTTTTRASDVDGGASDTSEATDPADPADASDPTDPADPTGTTIPTDPEVFDKGMAKMNAEIAAADGDVCKMLGALQNSSAVGNPSTPDQAKAAYQVIEAALTAIADAAPAASAADAEVIRTSVAKMMEAAKAEGYAVDDFNAGGPESISTEEFGLAMSRLFQQVGEKCDLGGSVDERPDAP